MNLQAGLLLGVRTACRFMGFLLAKMNTKFRKVLKRLKDDVAAYVPEEAASIKSKPRDITYKDLTSRLKYDPENGKFYWRNGQKAGKEAGHYGNTRGKTYVRIGFNGQAILAHVLAWFVVYGVWPTSELDHKDGDGTNNRADNLRLGNRAVNNSNTRKRVDSLAEPNIGHVASGKFTALAKFGGRTYWLGTFPTLKLAVKARDIAEKLIPRSENHRQELGVPLLKVVERGYDATAISDPLPKRIYKPFSPYTIIDNIQAPNA